MKLAILGGAKGRLHLESTGKPFLLENIDYEFVL
jgi:hypothetical protein